MATRVIAAQDKTSSGAGDDVQIKAGNANTSGAGGNIILQPGIQATTGGNGAVQIKAQSNGTAKLRLTEPTFGYSMAITMDDYYYASISFENGSVGLRIPSNMTIYKDGGIAATSGTYTGFGLANSTSTDNIGYLYMRSDGVVNWNGATGLTYGSVGTIRVSNASTGGGSLAYTSSTPTALSTNPTNNLVLTGSAFQRLSSSSALSVTGIAPPSTGAHVDGRLIWLYNVGSFNITLKHSQTSTAANQFINEGSGDVVLGPGRMVQAIYDSTSSKWRVNGETYPYVFPTADGTNGQVLTTNGSGTLSWTTPTGGVTGTGTTGNFAKFTSSTAVGNSVATETTNAEGYNIFTYSGQVNVGSSIVGGGQFTRSMVVANATKGNAIEVTKTVADGNNAAISASSAGSWIGAFYSTATTTKGLMVRGASGQTANLQEWQNNSGTVLSYVAPNGVPVAYGGGQISTNTAFGVSALTANTTGTENTAFGYLAGQSITTGFGNTAIGKDALKAGTGNYNTIVGGRAGEVLSTGGNNSSVGYMSLSGATTGGSNSALGFQALYTTNGSNNVGIGTHALRDATGSGNVAIGDTAARYQVSGASLTAATNCVYIGNQCRGFDNSDNNSIVIGYGAYGKGANTTVIGNTSSTESYVYGDNLYLGNGAGSQANIRPLARTTSGAGSSLVLWGANGVTSGNGGSVSLIGGYGPAGNGGDVFLKGGDSGGGTRDGTVISKVGGNGNYNCHEFRYGIAATYAFFDQLGRFCITPGTSTTAIPADATIYAATRSSATRGLIVKGAASQSANLTEWQDSTGTVVAAVSPNGAFTGSSFTPYGTINSTTTIFGNNYWTPNLSGVSNPSTGTFTKTSATADWQSQVYSSEGYTKNVYCAARASQTNGHIIFGLNSDPTTNASYQSIDYSWYCIGDGGGLQIYEDGASVGSFGSYTTSTVLSITYDGENVRYWKDGVLQRTVARSTGNPLYFDTSFYSTGASLNSVQFGPIGQPFGISGTAGYHPKFTSQQTLGNSIVYDNGTNVGIGTTSTTGKLTIANNGNQLTLKAYDGSQNNTVSFQAIRANYSDAASVLAIYTNSGSSENERVRIMHTGEMGIGTQSPGGMLDVQQSNAGDMLVRAWNTSTAGTGKSIVRIANSGNNAQGQQIQFSDNNYYTGTVSSDRTNGMSFYVGQMATPLASERVRIDTSGNVGVGAGARIGSGTGYINAGATAAGYLELYNATSGATTLMNTGAFNVLVGTNNTERIRVTSSGLVGIGTSTIAGNNPLADLHVNDASGYGSLQLSQSPYGATIDTGGEIQFAATYRSANDLTQVARIRGLRENATNNNWAGYLAFYTSTGSDNPSASTERMRINSSGNVGIGTASPSFKLQVDAASVDANIVANVTSGYGGIGVYAAGTNKVILGYVGANTNYGSQTVAGDIALKTNNSNLHITTGSGNSVTTAYFSSAGNVGIGNVSPGARLQVDTGATGTKGQIIKAVASQTANLSEWQNNSGTALSYVASNGDIYSTTSFVHYSSGNSGYYLKRPSDNATVASLTWSSGSIETNLYALTFLNLDSSGAGIRMGSWTTWADSVNAQVMWLKNSNIIWGNNALGVTGRTAFNTSAFQITAGSYATIPAPTSRFEVYGDSQFLSQSTSAKTVIVKAAASQTANLTEWQNNSGTALAYMDANGNFYAVSKSFLIDHPTPEKKAEGKKLRYASLEGPENGVYFRGRLDGENEIVLPDYWKDLVDPESITVNLTARKYAQPNLFVEDVSVERIRVSSGWPVCCDFIVYGTRKDIAKLEVEIDGN